MAELESFLRDGNHRKNYPNGDVYVGDWKDGRKNGKGTMTYRNGDTYVGNWVNGNKEGQGTSTSHMGRRVYTGNWSNNQKNGEGTMTSRVGGEHAGVDVTTYKGIWVNDNLPTGEIYYGKGDRKSDTYKGELRQRYHPTVDGLTVFVPHGRGGFYRDDDGTKSYDSNFNRGTEYGQSTTYYPDGSRLTSENSVNRPHPSPYLSNQKKPVRSKGTYGMTDVMMKELDDIYFNDRNLGGSKNKTKRRRHSKSKYKYQKNKKRYSFKKNTNKKRRQSHRKINK
jgi:hypothetical protein